MTRRRIVTGIFIIIAISLIGAAFLITIYGPSEPWYRYVFYFGAALTGVILLFAAIDQIMTRIEKIIGQEYSITNKKVAKIILHKLSVTGYEGVDSDIFDYYLISEQNELSREERLQLCDELEKYGLIQR